MRKEVFIKRKYYEDLLDSSTNSLKQGKPRYIALLGARKSGKTSLVKEHLKNAKDVISVYIDLNKIGLNPENFSIEFIGNVLFSFLKRPLNEYKDFLLLETLTKLEKEIRSKNAFSLIKNLENELQKIKPDQKLIVANAFRFAEILGQDLNKKFVIVLDDIEHLLELNNFSQVKDVLSLISFENENVSFIATSSAIKELLHTLKHFETYEIKDLEKNEAFELIESIIGKNTSARDEIFELGKGHVFATKIISERFKETNDAKKAFLIELLEKNNSLHNHCNDSLNYYYNRARGQTLLKVILKAIANEELRLSEIAKRIYRSAPVTKSILERLIEVDIIHKRANKFYFTDEILRFWVKLTSQGYEFEQVPEKILEDLAREL